MADSDKLTKIALAKRFGVTTRTVDNYVAEHMPHHGARKSLYFLWHECLAWWRAREIEKAIPPSSSDSESGDGVSLTEAERRKMLADAELKELKVAREKGKLVAIADVAAAQGQIASNIRTRLRALPAKLTPRLVGRRRQDIKTLLEKEIDAALTELAQTAGKIALPDEPAA